MSCFLTILLSSQDPEAFVADMKKMFDGLDAETIRDHTAEVFRDMIGERVGF